MSETPLQQRPLAAAILAAGLGSRLGGKPKSILQIDGTSILERLIRTLRAGGAQTVAVVVGPYREQLLPIIARCGAHEWVQDQHEPSLINSQRMALQRHVECHPHHDLMMTVADLAYLTAADMYPLAEAWQQREPTVDALWPVVNGVPGHPRFLSSVAVRTLHALAPSLGVQDGLRKLAAHRVQTWSTWNPAYISDIDTLEDLQAIKKKLFPRTVAWPSY